MLVGELSFGPAACRPLLVTGAAASVGCVSDAS